MKTRILSVILSLIMLVSLVPAGAVNASAAELSTSANAVTVLKQLEGYSKLCTNGYTGYGTLCTKSGDHADHETSETEASAALNAELKDLDKAVNAFASRNGLALSQGQHDALVLFSFQNGTAWTTGTGDFQNAIKKGAKGEDFLNAICWWNSSTSDDERRLIETNMYLNNVYSTYVPTRYIRVRFDSDGGRFTGAEYQYFDVASTRSLNVVADKEYSHFLGWYSAKEGGQPIYSLTTADNGKTLYARYQGYDVDPGWEDFHEMTNDVSYTLDWDDLESSIVYDLPNGKANDYQIGETMNVNMEYVDENNILWCHIYDVDYVEGVKTIWDRGWVIVGEAPDIDGSSSSSGLHYDMDVTVTVTNTYLRVRAESSIYSKELRQAHMGDQLRIVNTASGDGFLWGQIADSNNDGVCEGWVALMYTNFEEVRDQGKPVTSYNVVARATVVKPVNGYVNVRSDAGTDNQIVGALPYRSVVDIYEITYVNGIQWGRYSGGWFCLSYAEVYGLNVDDFVTSSGVLNYAFNGKIIANGMMPILYSEPSDTSEVIRGRDLSGTQTVTNLTRAADGITWGKIADGWLRVSDASGNPVDIELGVAKFYTVTDGVTVRTAPSTSADRVNNLTKGVEFNVNEKFQVVVVGDSIWGYADKVGEGEKTYSGWVNLASKYVARGDAPVIGNGNSYTGEMATIVGADEVNVRITHSIYCKILGKIPRGTTVAILDVDDGWYMLDYDVDNDPETDSWVSAQYVEVTEAPEQSTGNGATGNGGTAAVETGLGIVANTYSGVNVRTGPGTGYAQTGKLLPGTTVEILEVTNAGTTKWGRAKEGWVCMDYVTMVTNYEILDSLNGGNNAGSTVNGSEIAIYTGTANSAINIYKTTSTKADVVRSLNAGDPITMHEILEVVNEEVIVDNADETHILKTTEYWARVNDGYILNPAENLSLDTLDEAVYTITESETLNVRPGVGTASGNPVFKLTKGDQVVVTKLAIVGGNVWGFIEADAEKTYITDEDGNKVTEFDWNGEGWISLAYTTKGAVSIKTETPPEANQPSQPTIGAGSSEGGFVNNATGYRYTGKVINTNSLNVRATASDVAKIVTTLNNGANLVIYETFNDGVYAWGRCDAGWVYLYYVDLTPVVNGAVDARVVYNNNTIAYTDMNCTEVAGTYAKMSVVDIYEVVGKMARTDLGWINTDNLL